MLFRDSPALSQACSGMKEASTTYASHQVQTPWHVLHKMSRHADGPASFGPRRGTRPYAPRALELSDGCVPQTCLLGACPRVVCWLCALGLVMTVWPSRRRAAPVSRRRGQSPPIRPRLDARQGQRSGWHGRASSEGYDWSWPSFVLRMVFDGGPLRGGHAGRALRGMPRGMGSRGRCG